MKKFAILMTAVALVCFSVPALAADWNFYGSARMATFYVSDDFGDGTNAAGTDDKDTDLQWDFQGNSRIGANVRVENLRGQFELGLKGSGAGDVDVGTRRLYGTWNFGPGWMKVGKDYTPVSQFISGQVFDADLGLLGIGTQYGNRTGQIAFGFGGFEIALIQPNSGDIEDVNGVATGGDVDEWLPKIEAKWGMSFDAWNFAIRGGYQTYEIEDAGFPGNTEDIDVDSYTIGADGGFNFGPAYIKAAVSYGQNWGNAAWGLDGNRNQGSPAVWDGDDDTDDTDSWMASVVAGLKVSDMLSFEAGFGYREDDPDVNGSSKSKPWAVYGQSVIALAPGVYIIPEVGYFDGDETFEGDDATNTFYLGGKWQIDF